MKFVSLVLAFVCAVLAIDATTLHAAHTVTQAGALHYAHDVGRAFVAFYHSGGAIGFGAALSTGNLTLAD